MSKVLLDNWSIERVSANSIGNQEIDEWPKEVYHIIEAFLLWDDVCYVENDYTDFWKRTSLGKDLLQSLHPIRFEDETIMENIRFQYHHKYASKFSGTVCQGALEYMMICNHFGCNYFPSEERSQFIKSQLHELQNIIHIDSNNNGLRVSSLIDNEIQKFDEDYSLTKINIPSIAQYVINKSKKKTMYDVLMTALEMRGDKDIAKFREDLNALSMKNERDYVKLKKQIDYNIKDVSTSKAMSKLSWIEFKILVNWIKAECEVSAKFNFQQNSNNIKKPDFVINNVFLKKVLKNML